jgi:uncharacterized Rmd1/YagE family protein
MESEAAAIRDPVSLTEPRVEKGVCYAYRLVSRRFHLAEWDASIIRKLQTLESIYEKISDQVSNRRMELLEWVIIILIAVSIGLEIMHRVP